MRKIDEEIQTRSEQYESWDTSDARMLQERKSDCEKLENVWRCRKAQPCLFVITTKTNFVMQIFSSSDVFVR